MSQTRRNFLRKVGTSAGISALVLSGSSSMALANVNVQTMANASEGARPDDEIFWDKVREEFIIEKKLIMMNWLLPAIAQPDQCSVYGIFLRHPIKELILLCIHQN
jgi:hypothetical protein